MINIIEAAFRLSDATKGFAGRVRQFYYEVMLSGHACECCGGLLEMVEEGKSRCAGCQVTLDPTIAFQRCPDCGGQANLRIRRYVCGDCGQDIRSRFLFDGLVFDAEYFRQKMAEHRVRKQELRERVSEMLAGTRSGAIEIGSVEAADHEGLFAALNAMTLEAFAGNLPEFRDRFDLSRYQTHIRAHVHSIPINLNQIPPLSENTRLDRIWRFIAIVFLAHAGHANIWQEGEHILVIQRETDREGQAIHGELEEADGDEGHVGRAAAW